MNRPQARDGLPQPQRLRAMLVVLTGLSMSVLDGAIANIALPTIAAELRTDPASAVWVVNAYQLAGSVTPPAALRILQGLGGAGLMSVNTPLLRFIYPADQLGRGMGINAMVG